MVVDTNDEKTTSIKLKANKKFWVVFSTDTEDGTIDESMSPYFYGDEEAAIEGAIEEVEAHNDHNGVYIVAECRPIKSVKRPKVRVKDIKLEE